MVGKRLGLTPCEPALDQVPVDGRTRYLRRMQDLLLLCPGDPSVRERYYALLAGKVPNTARARIEDVIRANVVATLLPTTAWNYRLARRLHRFAVWLELRW